MGFGQRLARNSLSKISKKDIQPKKKKIDNKFIPYAREQLMFTDPSVKGHRFYVIKFKTEEDDPYSRGDIRHYAQNKSNELAKMSPTSVFSVTLKFINNNFKAGKRTIAGENVSLWDESDSGDYDQGDIIGFHIIMSVPI